MIRFQKMPSDTFSGKSLANFADRGTWSKFCLVLKEAELLCGDILWIFAGYFLDSSLIPEKFQVAGKRTKQG